MEPTATSVNQFGAEPLGPEFGLASASGCARLPCGLVGFHGGTVVNRGRRDGGDSL